MPIQVRPSAAGWIERTSWDHRKQPSFNPPVGDALHPEQSTDALIVHHPEAKYFNAR